MRIRVAMVVALLAGLVAHAHAQGFQLDRYEPTPAGESFFMVEHPWYSSLRWFAGGLTLDYAHKPLVAGIASGESFNQQVAVIEHQFVMHVDLAASFMDRALVETSLPFTLGEGGMSAIGVTPMFGAAPGDPRIGLFIRVFGHADRDPISMSIGAHLWIPIGEKGNYTGDDNVRGMPVLTLGGFALHHLTWAFNLGVLLRPSAQLGTLPDQNAAGSELRFSGAIAWTDRRQDLQIGPELAFGTLLVGDHVFRARGSSLEILGGLKYTIIDTIQIGAAAGFGVLSEVGTPDARALLRIAYAPKRRPKPVPVAVVAPPPPPPPAPPPPPPPKDSDGDSVIDKEDACPDQPGVLSQDPEHNGCPPHDADRDGIPDASDACPDEPGRVDADPRQNGCPPPKIKVEKSEIKTLEPIFFASGSDEILPQSFPLLEEMAKALKEHDEITLVSIEGHTDDRGKALYNLHLSQRRAESVMKFLVAHGVAESRLEAHGYGKTKPLVQGTDEAARAKNRRVEFRIVGRAPEAPPSP